MFRELIDKLKAKKKQIQNCRTDNNIIEIKPIDQNRFYITISNQNNISKIEINDYISIGDYVSIMKSSNEYRILDLLCNCVVWNSNKQKVNKGTYYVITINNYIYNILFAGDKIIIDERTNKELDEQTQKENIIQERVITFYIKKMNIIILAQSMIKQVILFIQDIILKIDCIVLEHLIYLKKKLMMMSIQSYII